MRALSEKRLSDYMAQQIADEILSGRIAGGTQLKQEELAEMFGTSRIPIREAFQVLEGQGLIVRLATRRIYAVELSEEQIQIIYEMIGDILKKAVKNLENEDKVKEMGGQVVTQENGEITFHFKDGHTETRQYRERKRGTRHSEAYRAYMHEIMQYAKRKDPEAKKNNACAERRMEERG